MASSLEPSKLSPLLPWEVIERIISHSCDRGSHELALGRNSKRIRSFSLTCRQLRPRSLCFLVADPTLSNRNCIFGFCDFLQAQPHLKPFVRSITVDPIDFAPVPLLRILPDLYRINFTDFGFITRQLEKPKMGRRNQGRKTRIVSKSVLTCCQLLGTRIQTLSLSHLYFETYLQCSELLSAFMGVVHLQCSNVLIREEGDPTVLHAARRRLSRCSRLLTLVISHEDATARRTRYYDKASMGKLLVDSALAQSTIESLTVREVYRSSGLSGQLNWSRLRSLTLKLSSAASEDIAPGVAFLRDFHHSPVLKEVAVEIRERSLVAVIENLERYADLYRELEHALLRFAHPRLVWILKPLRVSRGSLRVQEFRWHFPVLFSRDALTVVPHAALPARHMSSVSTVVISPNGKWVASGSCDGTVILWDISDGAMVDAQWAPYGQTCGPLSLAFSPDSQYLVSGARSDRRVALWDLNEGASMSRVLKGHTTDSDGIASCVWSPRGDVIAAARRRGRDGAVVAQLWDANNFWPLHVLQHPAGSDIWLVEFSPNGRWLLTGCVPNSYHLWDVKSGTGRQLRTPQAGQRCPDILGVAAAFDPGSTRVVLISPTGFVEILSIEGPEEGSCVVLRADTNLLLGVETRGVAFLPHGDLVLTVSNKRVHTHALKLWEAHTGDHLLSLEGHEKEVRLARFSPCGRYVASASRDRTVRLWRTRDGTCVATLSEHDSEVFCLAFSLDGETLILGADDGSVIMRRMRDVLPVDERNG